MSTAEQVPDVAALLRAASTRRLQALSYDWGVPTFQLASWALTMAADPAVYAGFPRECRVILDARDRARAARSAPRRPD